MLPGVVRIVCYDKAGGKLPLFLLEGLDELGRLGAGRRAHVQHLRRKFTF